MAKIQQWQLLSFNYMFAWLNVNLLIITFIFSLGWSIGSHFLNINEPGKAKFFGLYWLIVSGACVGGYNTCLLYSA